MLTRYRAFAGTIPRRSPRLLPPNAAQRAVNCKLWQGEVRPVDGPRVIETPFHGANAETIYRYEDAGVSYWFNWDGDVDLAEPAIGDDSLNRIFYTGDGEPKKTANDIGIPAGLGGVLPASWYKMGVKTPATAPSLNKTVSGSGVAEVRYYVFTFVTGWGEEGAPSTPTEITGVEQTGSTVEVDLSGESNPDTRYNITKVRVYRTLSGATATDFAFVKEFTWDYTTAANNKVDDDLDANELGAPLATYDFDEPPSDLTSLVAMANGMMAGFSGKYIYFSEPNLPYAWPQKYRKAVKRTPVALGALGTVLVVATNGQPEIFKGVHPSLMTGATLPHGQACKSKRSLVQTQWGVLWASPDGLFLVDPSGSGRTVTRELLTRDEWQVLQPGTMIGVVHDGRYYCSYVDADSGARRLLIFDPNEPEQAFTESTLATEALYSDEITDQLYLLLDGLIQQWEGDPQNPLEADWQGRREPQEGEVNKAYARLKGDFALQSIIGGTLDFDGYNALRDAIVAFNEGLYENLTTYAPQAFGTYSFGEHAFAGDDGLGGLPEIGQGVTFRLYGNDDVLRFEKLVKDEEPFTLPGGFVAHEYSGRTTGRVKIEEMQFADGFDDFKSG